MHKECDVLMKSECSAIEPTGSAPFRHASSLGQKAGQSSSSVAAGSSRTSTVEHGALIPLLPPPEVRQALVVASRSYERLSAAGRQIHFRIVGPGEAVSIELHDLAGNPVSTIPASEALRIADGESLN